MNEADGLNDWPFTRIALERAERADYPVCFVDFPGLFVVKSAEEIERDRREMESMTMAELAQRILKAAKE